MALRCELTLGLFMKNIVTLAAFILILDGCAHSSERPTKEASDSGTEAVRRRASADLNCPEESLEVRVLETGNMFRPWTFSAKGCNQSASYLSRMGTIIRN